MSNADTNNIGIKLQVAGENLNTWGDPNLNNDLIVLSNLASKWNPITINGDYTASETNYLMTNATEVATIKLVAGTVAANFAFIMSGRPKRVLIWNSTAFTATARLSASTGFALPAGRFALIATDGATDVYNLTPNYGGVASPLNPLDIPSWSAVQTAIATAELPATSGTVLNSGTDTTAGYLSTKISITGSGAASVTPSTISPGANEVRSFVISVGALGLTLQAPQATNFAAAAGKLYPVDCTSSGVTVTLPTASGTFGFIGLVKFGLFPMTLSGTVNGLSSGIIIYDEGLLPPICDSGASRGWV